jgi:acyl-CoA synthetase (AMP-forming)/AMP-acid ligase II
MMAGYLGRPDLTAEVLSDGWLRTGDVGRLDAAGYVYVTDRAKDMIVSGGMNIFPAEVERVLVQVPGVAEVAVIGVPHPQWGETVAAVVVPEPGATVTAEDLTAHARRHLAGYKKPTRVEFVDALPRTASLKVRKEELRTRFAGKAPEA